LSMHICFVLFPLFDLSFVDFPSVLRYCWLGLLTCKNRLPYKLYCVGGDVKHCTIQSNRPIYTQCYDLETRRTRVDFTKVSVSRPWHQGPSRSWSPKSWVWSEWQGLKDIHSRMLQTCCQLLRYIQWTLNVSETVRDRRLVPKDHGPSIKWSRDRWRHRHVTLKGQPRDTNTHRAQYLENGRI